MAEIVKNQQETNDLTQGNLLKKIILFTLPIIATGVLQLLFNTADMIVVKLASSTAVAAVGATNALNSLIVNLIMGLSVGAGVLVARYFGSKDAQSMHEVVHTAIPTALIGGIIFGAIGFIFAPVFLKWMGTPDNVIDQSTTYIRIIFCGMPFNIVYNFGASILRSVGNTKKPLSYLIIAGVINVVLNMFFVVVLNRDVDGVALATIISQLISAVLVVRSLTKTNEAHKLQIKKIKIYPEQLKKMVTIGLPAGIQGAVFSISNILIQSSVNSFGDLVMSGNAASHSIEGYVYTAMNSFHQTAVAFVGQHIGANKHKRVLNICLTCVACVSVVGVVLGAMMLLFAKPLLSLFANEEIFEHVINYGLIRLKIFAFTYFLCGVMDVLCGILRGMGKSTESMIISLLCVCGLRILWIYTFFQANRTLETLYYSYPISWIVCIAVDIAMFVVVYRKMMKKVNANSLLAPKLTEKNKTTTVEQ